MADMEASWSPEMKAYARQLAEELAVDIKAYDERAHRMNADKKIEQEVFGGSDTDLALALIPCLYRHAHAYEIDHGIRLFYCFECCVHWVEPNGHRDDELIEAAA